MQKTKTDTGLFIDAIKMQRAALIFRAINHPLRQQIMGLLHTHPGMSVTELYRKLKLEQSVASQHLAILRRANFVSARRESKKVFYSVNYGRLEYVTAKANALI